MTYANDYAEYSDLGGPEGIEEYYQWKDQQRGELAAENAWLHAAEAGYDDGFEQWEMERGCYLDPQSGYSI